MQSLEAGTTVYTDHAPSTYVGSLSNKGRLSIWRIHETSDLTGIVQTEKVNGYQDRELLYLSDKLCHLVCDLLRERSGDEEVKVFFIVRPYVGDGVLGNAPSLENPCSGVCVLLRGDPDAVCGSD
jgi:hypothetical protein